MEARGVVIIGGGPIGLAHAIGIKKLNPKIPVTVYEKYEVYQRSHTLVMQPTSLEAFMKATNAKEDPTLAGLLADLKKDPHIKTNALEDKFKTLALSNGVEIITETITQKNIETLFNPAPIFVIGADGTHGITNQSLFPQDNQVKVPFDYVLQFRFDVKGPERANRVSPISFYQRMARHGMIANEYVGVYDQKTHSTPVTMQMMISEEAFKTLFPIATSKSPIKPLEVEMELEYEAIPKNIKAFFTGYLNEKILPGEESYDNIRISVNEAPATYVKQPICFRDSIPVLLAGDAALGLSYFKGLNAGLLSTAQFFYTFKHYFKTISITSDPIVNLPLAESYAYDYRKWFVNVFAPKKIREVEQYSTWNIRAAMALMKTIHWIKASSSREEDLEDYNEIFNFLRSQPNFTRHPEAAIFPHRQYPLVKLGQFAQVPVGYTLNKIKKLFADYVKPYKSVKHVTQDYKQPGAGVLNTVVGLGKAIHGIATLNGSKVADGGVTFLRGSLELITAPFALFIKPITRFIATMIHGVPKIEEMSGMKKLAKIGHEKIDAIENYSEEDKYSVLAIAMDLHRKFNKGIKQEQPTCIKLEEQVGYQNLKNAVMNLESDEVVAKTNIHAYFSLFAPSRSQRQIHEDTPLLNEENNCKFKNE